MPLIPEQEQAGFNRVVSTRTASFVTSTLFYLNKVYKKTRKSAKKAQLVKKVKNLSKQILVDEDILWQTTGVVIAWFTSHEELITILPPATSVAGEIHKLCRKGSCTMTRQENTTDLHREEVPSAFHFDVCELQQHTITLPLPSDLPLEAMSVSLLAECCIGEMNKYRRGEPHTDRYCVELFRRALVQRDTLAWEVMQKHFHNTMLRWMYGHPMRDNACRFDSEENYVAQAFARFWLATADNQQVEFQSVAAALRYLRMSLQSVILDALRAYSRPKEVPLPEYGNPEEPFGEDTHEGHEVWEAILPLLPDSRDQRVAYLLFHCGLKPREILRFCPQEFSDVQEVYRLRRNIMERLLRHADYLRWRLGQYM